MKFVSISANGNQRIGILEGNDRCRVLGAGIPGFPNRIEDLIRDPKQSTLLQEVNPSQDPGSESVALSNVEMLAPVREIEKVICIGTNYADHALEMGGQPPEIPVVFNVFPSAIVGPEAPVCLPEISESVDFEAELVVVIGAGGRDISRESAMEHVFGYCCGNDVSARDWQKGKPGGQWLLGKTFDTFAPLGPWIATRDEVPDPHNLDIQLRLNGQIMQESNTRHFIFPIDFLISHLSKFVTLAPGDLIFTGTPSGVGAGRTPPIFLKPGDRMEVEIEGLGVLTNPVVASC